MKDLELSSSELELALHPYLVRSKVIKAVLMSVHAYAQYDDKKLRAIAQRCGVTLEALVEARTIYKRRKLRERRTTTRVIVDLNRREERLPLFMPEACKAKLLERFDTRGVENSVLLRSIIHHYLLRNWEPEQVARQWTLDGVEYKGRSGGKCNIKTNITEAAIHALKYRAKRLRVRYRSLLRQLVMSAYHGEFAKTSELRYISVENMYLKVSEYLNHVQEADSRRRIVRKPRDENDLIL